MFEMSSFAADVDPRRPSADGDAVDSCERSGETSQKRLWRASLVDLGALSDPRFTAGPAGVAGVIALAVGLAALIVSGVRLRRSSAEPDVSRAARAAASPSGGETSAQRARRFCSSRGYTRSFAATSPPTVTASPS